MSRGELVVPLAPDCEALRQFLIDDPLPAVWSLDASVARGLYDEGVAKTRAAWRPDLESLPVDVIDVPRTRGQVASRIYVPTARVDRPLPTIMWLHGGGWVLGDLDAADATARTAAVATGCTVVSVDYRCAPVDPFPAAVDDVLAAVDALLAQGRTVVVAGDSAGANLAAYVAQARADHPRLVGQVLVYPATDPAMSSASYREFTEGPFLSAGDMAWFYDQYLGASRDRSDERVALDARAQVASLVPAVVLTVGHDPLRDEGIAYADALRTAGGQVRWIHAPELFHGAFTQSGVLPSSARRVTEVWAAAQELFI